MIGQSLSALTELIALTMVDAAFLAAIRTVT
jgi:hypothetical protein